MDKWFFIFITVMVLTLGSNVIFEKYINSKKAEFAIVHGLQECTEVDNFSNTIIVYKKDCK